MARKKKSEESDILESVSDSTDEIVETAKQEYVDAGYIKDETKIELPKGLRKFDKFKGK